MSRNKRLIITGMALMFILVVGITGCRDSSGGGPPPPVTGDDIAKEWEGISPEVEAALPELCEHFANHEWNIFAAEYGSPGWQDEWDAFTDAIYNAAYSEAYQKWIGEQLGWDNWRDPEPWRWEVLTGIERTWLISLQANRMANTAQTVCEVSS